MLKFDCLYIVSDYSIFSIQEGYDAGNERNRYLNRLIEKRGNGRIHVII